MTVRGYTNRPTEKNIFRRNMRLIHRLWFTAIKLTKKSARDLRKMPPLCFKTAQNSLIA